MYNGSAWIWNEPVESLPEQRDAMLQLLGRDIAARDLDR